jgi:uncharacterized protein (DUF488 family)
MDQDPDAAPTLCTIGYERDTLDGLIGRLKAAGVDIVIDVRAVAASRRPGFSKTMLGASLKADGIDYTHLRALGTPKAGREAARAGRTEVMREIFAAHMAEPAAQLALSQATEITHGRRAALLCFEAEAACCHRAILANAIRQRLKCEIVDL